MGVNLRVASYAEVSPEHLRILREALRSTSRVYSAEFVPVPIAHRAQMDAGTLRELLADMPGEDVDGGASLDTPQLVLHRIRQCRVVVSGSYHAAVFALAQGIPAVALASSQYYLDKMRGLRDQFGEGCAVVPLEAGLPARVLFHLGPERRLGECGPTAADISAGARSRSGGERACRVCAPANNDSGQVDTVIYVGPFVLWAHLRWKRRCP